MRTINVYLSIGYSNAMHDDTLDVDDNATDDDIDEMVRDWAHNYIEWGWRENEQKEPS